MANVYWRNDDTGEMELVGSDPLQALERELLAKPKRRCPEWIGAMRLVRSIRADREAKAQRLTKRGNYDGCVLAE